MEKQTDTLWGSIALKKEEEEEEGAAVKQWAESWLDKQQQSTAESGNNLDCLVKEGGRGILETEIPSSSSFLPPSSSSSLSPQHQYIYWNCLLAC